MAEKETVTKRCCPECQSAGWRATPHSEYRYYCGCCGHRFNGGFDELEIAETQTSPRNGLVRTLHEMDPEEVNG